MSVEVCSQHICDKWSDLHMAGLYRCAIQPSSVFTIIVSV